MDLVTLKIQIRYYAARFQHLCALLAPNLRLITVHSAPIIFRSTCTGGAQPPVARARAPVCPGLATPLDRSRHGGGVLVYVKTVCVPLL